MLGSAKQIFNSSKDGTMAEEINFQDPNHLNRREAEELAIPTAGTKQTGMARGCYDGLTLREQGAPEEFMRQAPICTPAEIGK